MEFKKSKHEPFIIVKDENGKYVICAGEARVSNKEFNNIDDAERYIGTKPYELIFNTMFYCINLNKNEKKAKRSTKKTATTTEESAENK